MASIPGNKPNVSNLSRLLPGYPDKGRVRTDLSFTRTRHGPWGPCVSGLWVHSQLGVDFSRGRLFWELACLVVDFGGALVAGIGLTGAAIMALAFAYIQVRRGTSNSSSSSVLSTLELSDTTL